MILSCVLLRNRTLSIGPIIFFVVILSLYNSLKSGMLLLLNSKEKKGKFWDNSEFPISKPFVIIQECIADVKMSSNIMAEVLTSYEAEKFKTCER